MAFKYFVVCVSALYIQTVFSQIPGPAGQGNRLQSNDYYLDQSELASIGGIPGLISLLNSDGLQSAGIAPDYSSTTYTGSSGSSGSLPSFGGLPSYGVLPSSGSLSSYGSLPSYGVLPTSGGLSSYGSLPSYGVLPSSGGYLSSGLLGANLGSGLTSLGSGLSASSGLSSVVGSGLPGALSASFPGTFSASLPGALTASSPSYGSSLSSSFGSGLTSSSLSSLGSNLSGFNAVASGPVTVSSISPFGRSGLTVISENYLEGLVTVTGQAPFMAAVAIEGALPTTGTGVAACSCGDGNVGILTDDYLSSQVLPSFGYGSLYY